MTYHLKKILLACVCVGFINICSAQLSAAPTEQQLVQKGSKELLGDELRALLTNQTLYHSNLSTGQTYPMYFRDDGKRFVKVGNNVRSTKWWMKDGRRCEDSIGKPRQVCQKHFNDEGVLRVCADGDSACHWLITVSPGDVEGISK
jgi:hypothetical protein